MDTQLGLVTALRTTGACRDFLPDPVDDAALDRVLETARFAPSGGNRQGWRVVVVKDASIRATIQELYRPGWRDYLAQGAAGMTPWSPVNDRARESEAIAAYTGPTASWADGLADVPVLLVLCADLSALATVDRDLDRYTLVGGASIYPFAWSILLAARAEGLAGVLTTMPIREEPALKDALAVPAQVVVAGVIVLGHPRHQPHRLRRRAVAEFTTVDRYDGAPFAP